MEISTSDFAGVYKDIADVVGIEATILLHRTFRGQQITFPKKLYTKDFIVAQIETTNNGTNVKKIASEFWYTERRLRQILKESNC
ncbi:MAG: Mor transcription activator family protein [Lachnospiraceae bacterium]|nr:Mor transcription activator family protein [Lachnospiraceae bacterium]